MKRLPKNKLVLIVARDWESNPTWQSEEARKEPAPLGEIVGMVDHQDDTTLTLTHAKLGNEGDTTKIPIGCIEAVWSLVVDRNVFWKKR